MKRIILFLFFYLYLLIQNRFMLKMINNKSVVGSWLGKLNVSSINLRIIFNLSLIEKDSIVATLDSPDQGANNIKIGPVTLGGNDISIKAPLLLAEYTGTS